MLALATVLLGLFAPLTCADERDDLLLEVRNQRDRVRSAIFDAIAAFADERALAASIDAVEVLRDESKLIRAYGAFRAYLGKVELEESAVAFVVGAARDHRRVENRRAATRELRHFGERVRPELEAILRTTRDAKHASYACMQLLDVLGARGDTASLRAVLDHATLDSRDQRERVAATIARFVGPEADRLIHAHVRASDTSVAWRRLLVERVIAASDPADAGSLGESLVGPLVELLDVEDDGLRLRVIEELGARAELAAVRPLWSLLRSKEPAVLRASIVALGRILVDDPKWHERLFELAAHREPAARMGAAVALAELRTADAVRRLYELLGDGDRRVRLEALWQVGNLRRADSVPLLVERMERDEPRLRHDAARVLRLVTGLDHGLVADRWRAWWSAEGATFRVPRYEDALAAELERRERRAENASQATFYGLQIYSPRVAFVLDTSGSMSEPARTRPQRTSSKEGDETTKLEVAKDELTRALSVFPEGDWFNVVFFASRANAMSDMLVQMDDEARARAMGYVREQRAGGATALYDALMLALADERVDTIYALSDGAPNAGELADPGAIRAELRRLNAVRKVQIHGIAVGQSSALLEGLAADSGGEYREFL